MGEAFSDPLTALLERHPDVHGDLLEYRLAIEGASAYYAALQALTKTAINSAHAMKLYWRRMAVLNLPMRAQRMLVFI